MRHAKLFTLSAVVGLSLISDGNSAIAAPTNFQGTVPSSCTVATTDPAGPLSDTPTGFPATALEGNGSDRGTVTVICNDSTKSLKLEIDSSSSVVYNGTAKIRFNGVAGGVFGTANLPTGAPSSSPITVPIPNPTAATGAIGRIQARIDAPALGLLLTATDYKLVVKATIIP